MLTKIHNTVYTIERIFLLLAIFSVGLLFVFQFLHMWDGNISSNIYKSLLHFEDYETKPIFSAGKVTLSIPNNQNLDTPLSVFVNGEIYGKFLDNQMDIIVRNHDIISVVGITDSSDSIQFKVINTSNNILYPQTNSQFTLDQDTNQLFSVEFR